MIQLEFYLDYLTATTVTNEFPSGYKSLGPFGGEGRIIIGTLNPADISWDTSLSRNLNNTGYCRIVNSAANCTAGNPSVNLLISSPPTASPKSYVITNGLDKWNFHDTYYVTIKKAKLQSLGLLDANGKLVPGWKVESDRIALHNSPAKTCPNFPPVAQAGASPASGYAPLVVTFSSAGSSDPNGVGDISSYSWAFGDGTTSTLANPSHTYSKGGTYVAVLTVTDSWGVTGTSPVTISAQDSLDVVVSSLVASTSSMAPGAVITVTDTTMNQGSLQVPASKTYIYYTSNGSFTGATKLGERLITQAINPGSSSSGSTTVTIPPTAVPGTRYLLALADGGSAIHETRENNNMRTIPIVINGPDLYESSLSVSSTSVIAGATITVSDTTKNQGIAQAGLTNTYIYFSSTASLTGATKIGERVLTLPLDPGSSSSGSTSVQIPTTATAGTWYVIVQADGGNTVTESIETNNTKYRSITVK